MEDIASSLLDGIDKEKELVVIWCSPKRRARQTADIISLVFDRANVSSRKPRIVWSLRDIILTEETNSELPEEGRAKSWMEYWTHAAKLPIGMETPVLIRKRVMGVIADLIRLSHGVGLEKEMYSGVVCY